MGAHWSQGPHSTTKLVQVAYWWRILPNGPLMTTTPGAPSEVDDG